VAVAASSFQATVGLDDVHVIPVEQLSEPSGFMVNDPDSLIAEIERRNPGLALTARANTVANWRVAAAIGRVLPSVSAFWSSSYTGDSFPTSYDRWRDGDVTSYGLNATFPLLDLKSYVLDIVDARAESRRAHAASRTAALQLHASATAAVLEYEEAQKRHAYSTKNLELNRKLSGLAREQQRLGAISLLDFLTVEAALTQAQAAHIDALCDTYIQAAWINYLLGAERREVE